MIILKTIFGIIGFGVIIYAVAKLLAGWMSGTFSWFGKFKK